MTEEDPNNGLTKHVRTIEYVMRSCDAATFSAKYLDELVWEMNWSISMTKSRIKVVEQLIVERDALLLRVAELEAERADKVTP